MKGFARRCQSNKLEALKANLTPSQCINWTFVDSLQTPFCSSCRIRLANEYQVTTEFTDLWDRLQSEGKCCGVTGSQVSSLSIVEAREKGRCVVK